MDTLRLDRLPEAVIISGIVVLGAILFIPWLGKVHLFDWDEINFAESAREMIVTGDYLTVRIGYAPFWEKPPLFIWMQVISMKLLGINEFAARFPNAICGIVTLLSIYLTGRYLFGRAFGLLWALAYMGSVLPFFYFKSGIIDPWFNLFIFLGISFFVFYLNHDTRSKIRIILSSAFIGLAILTKGPVAFLIFLITAFVIFISSGFRLRLTTGDVLLFITILILVGGFWFILQLANGNYSLVVDFIRYQIRLFSTKDAGHGGFLLYHFVVLLLGVFPASLFAVAGHRRILLPYSRQREYQRWMLTLLWVVLVLFTIVKTKIIHYSSLAYFPITFLAALYLSHSSGNTALPRWIKTSIYVVGALLCAAVISLPVIHWFKDDITAMRLIKNEFALGNLAAPVSWTGLEMLAAFPLFAGMVVFGYLSKARKIIKGVVVLFASTIVFTFATLAVVTPRIEGYSQRAAIEFFKDYSDQDVYLETLGYKSYAHLFYGNVQPRNRPKHFSKEWLLRGDIDKDALFSAKIHRKQRYLDENPELEVLYEKNGFVFFKRTTRPQLNVVNQ